MEMHLEGQRFESRSQNRFTKNILMVDFSIPKKAPVVSVAISQSFAVNGANSVSIIKRTYVPD